MNRNSFWMVVSGATGLTLFLIANLTEVFVGLNVSAGVVQIAVNAFVFITWFRGFREERGLKKLVAFFGVIVPFVMAGITLYRVLVPALL